MCCATALFSSERSVAEIQKSTPIFRLCPYLGLGLGLHLRPCALPPRCFLLRCFILTRPLNICVFLRLDISSSVRYLRGGNPRLPQRNGSVKGCTQPFEKKNYTLPPVIVPQLKCLATTLSECCLSISHYLYWYLCGLICPYMLESRLAAQRSSQQLRFLPNKKKGGWGAYIEGNHEVDISFRCCYVYISAYGSILFIGF